MSKMFTFWFGVFSVISSAAHSVEKSPSQLLCDEYESRARSGETLAQVQLGNCYLLGLGREENPTAAVHWFEQSIDGGSALGMTSLASAHLFRRVPHPNYEYAVQLLERVVGLDPSPTAHFVLGLAHNKGLGVERDRAIALTHITEAACGGHAMARFVLFISHELGLFELKKDERKAAKWREKLEYAVRFERTATVEGYASSVLEDERISEYVFEAHEFEQVARYFQ